MASKRALKRRLRNLESRERQERRDLGTAALEMYREDRLDLDDLRARGSALAEISGEISSIRLELGEEPGGEPATGEVAGPGAAQVEQETGDVESPVSIEQATAEQPVAGLQQATDEHSTAEDHLATEEQAAPEEPGDRVEVPVEQVTGEGRPEAHPGSGAHEQAELNALLAEIDAAERTRRERVAGPGPDARRESPGEPSVEAYIERLEDGLRAEREQAIAEVSELRERVERAEQDASNERERAAEAERAATARVEEAGRTAAEAQARARSAAAEWIRRQAGEIPSGSTATEAGRSEADDLRGKLAEAERQRDEAVKAAEARLEEIEGEAESAGRRVAEAERRIATEHEQALAEAEERARAAEAAARTAAAQWLRAQVRNRDGESHGNT